MIAFPNISPEIVTITIGNFQLPIRWYAMAYLAGLLIGWWIMLRLMRRDALWGDRAPMTPPQVEGLLTWVILGVVLGGRLGYVLFYNSAFYLENPSQIMVLWRGGMSFHGGFLGVVIAAWIYAGVQGIPRLRMADALAVATPVGLGLGRIANFINAELWGRPTDAPWGVVFPGDAAQSCAAIGELCARHPSQLYEAGLEGILLALILFAAVRLGALRRPGLALGIFLTGYGLARGFVEHFREADAQFVSWDNPLGHVVGGPVWGLSMGQVLSLPMIVIGVAFILFALRKPKVAA